MFQSLFKQGFSRFSLRSSRHQPLLNMTLSTVRRARVSQSASLGVAFGILASLSCFAAMPLVAHAQSQEPNPPRPFMSANFIADAAEIAAPAVVNILSPMGGVGRAVGAAAAGSGFIVSRHGYVVTNAHVVQHSQSGKVIVTFWNGKKKPGIIHAVDPKSDLAIVKLLEIDGEELPVAKLGSSSALRVGEFVVALGSPMNLLNTVTFGIVSSTARHASELDLSRNRNEYIQTDAAINQGNSGGPLVNIRGEVIGINTMKLDNSAGISFAIPIDSASRIIRQLITQQHVVRPYIGLRMAPYVDGQAVRSKGRSMDFVGDNLCIAVVDVEPGSPAAVGGLKS